MSYTNTKQYWPHVHLIFMLILGMLNTSLIDFRKHGYILMETTMLYNNTEVTLIERWNQFAFFVFTGLDSSTYRLMLDPDSSWQLEAVGPIHLSQ